MADHLRVGLIGAGGNTRARHIPGLRAVADPGIDAIIIGTWPYLHCEITLATLAAGKHVLTEARMAMNAAEAHRMLGASRRHEKLVTQIVPSPFGLGGGTLVRELLAGGY